MEWRQVSVVSPGRTDDWIGNKLASSKQMIGLERLSLKSRDSHSLVAWLLLLQSEAAYPRLASPPYLCRLGSGSTSAAQGSLEILNVVILVGGEKL